MLLSSVVYTYFLVIKVTSTIISSLVKPKINHVRLKRKIQITLRIVNEKIKFKKGKFTFSQFGFIQIKLQKEFDKEQKCTFILFSFSFQSCFLKWESLYQNSRGKNVRCHRQQTKRGRYYFSKPLVHLLYLLFPSVLTHSTPKWICLIFNYLCST